MKGKTFIDSLSSRGVRLTANGDRLRVKGPRDLITDELTTAVAGRKGELMAILCGHDFPSSIEGISWTPRGGVVLDKDRRPDLRSMCATVISSAGYPSATFQGQPLFDEPSWAGWIGTACINHVAAVALHFDGLGRMA